MHWLFNFAKIRKKSQKRKCNPKTQEAQLIEFQYFIINSPDLGSLLDEL